MKPVRNNVLVKPFPSEEMSLGGMYVPENCREVNNKVHIVKVGTGTPKKPMLLKEGTVGHRVKLWGQEIMVNGELHFLMDSSAIIAIEN